MRLAATLLLSLALAAPAASVARAPSVRAAPGEAQRQRVAQALSAARAEFGFPGAVAAYVLPDGSVHSVAVGLADRERDQPMGRDSRFMSGSTGKSFVAALALSLERERKLDLDAPIAHYLSDRPWFSRLPGGDRITTRQLLMQRSGLVDHVYTAGFARDASALFATPDRFLTPEQCISYVLDSKLKFAPGTGYSYTDTGYLIVGLILEKVTGRRYYDLVAERFLKPLRLSATSPAISRALPGLVQGYPSPDTGFPLPPTMLDGQRRLRWNPASEWTGGGFATDPADLARWGWALYGGRAMRAGYLAELTRGEPETAASARPAYALGTSVYDTAFGTAYGHGGWYPGYRTDLTYYPSLRTAVAFQINTDGRAYGGQRMAVIRDRLARAVAGPPRDRP